MGPVRLLEVEPRSVAVVADAPLDRYGEEAINRGLSDLDWVSRAAVAHEAVVESFIDAAGGPADEAVHDLHQRRPRARARRGASARGSMRVVKRVAESARMGRARRARSRAGTRPPRRRKQAHGCRRDRRPARLSHAKEGAARRGASSWPSARAKPWPTLYDRLARASRWRAPARERAAGEGGPLLLDAAFLVPRRAPRRFGRSSAREARRWRRRATA